MEAYPTLRRRVGIPAIPRVVMYAAALGVAALVLFLGPTLFAPAATSTPRPSGVAASGSPRATASGSGRTATASPAESTTAVESPTVYVVVQGDTLTKIAKKYGVTVDAILDANPQIKDPDQVAIGDELTIPPKESPTSTGAGNAVPATEAPAETETP